MSSHSSASHSLTSSAFSSEERGALHRAILLLEEFRKVYPEMPIQQAVTLLTVAYDEGKPISSIVKTAGMGTASASRHVTLLGPPTLKYPKALSLVTILPNPMDGREKFIHLTAAGRRLAKSIIHLIKN